MDIAWENGELTELKVKSLLGNPCKIIYENEETNFETVTGEEIVLNQNLER